MSKQFHYEDLSCLALQNALNSNGFVELAFSGEQAQAFENIAQSLNTGQEIGRKPFAILKTQILSFRVFIRLLGNIRLAWKTMFKYYRFSEFRTFWQLEEPLYVTHSAQSNGVTIFKVCRLTSHSSRDDHEVGAP